jgi:HK97 family phage major capsid protein
MVDLPVFYDHAQQSVKALDNEIGRVVSTKRDETGVWFEAELDKAHEYLNDVLELVKRGVVGLSTGAVSHLVRRDEQKHIKRWPVAELSLTVTPAEPRTLGVAQIKATSGDLDTAEGAAEAETQTAPVPAGDPVADIRIEGETQEEKPIMAEDIKQAAEQAADPGAEVKALRDELSALRAELTTPVKSVGYAVTEDKLVETEKRFNGFLKAVRERDSAAIKSYYSRDEIKLAESTGAGGGYTIPEQFMATILGVMQQNSPIVNAVTTTPVNAPSGKMPSLDLFAAPTAGVGDTAAAGRVTAATRAESGQYTSTDARFQQISWDVSDAVSGIIPVTREFRQDAPFDLNSLMTVLIGNAAAAKLEYYILRGTGVGQPLGILNAPAKVDVTPATNNLFAMADASNMLARFKRFGDRAQCMWVHHASLQPDLDAIAAAGGSTVTFVTPTSDVYPPLRGYRLVESEHVAQADASGCIVLVDLSAYMLFTLGGLYIEFDEYYDFDNGLSAWRFGQRLDGKPWLKSAITLGGPGSAYTKSAFINFND